MALEHTRKELKDLQKDSPTSYHAGILIAAEPVVEDMFHWQVTIKGPPDTPYSGVVFLIAIHVPPKYHFKPPKVLLSICLLLSDPDPHDRCAPDVAYMYNTDRMEYESTARSWTQKYAMG